MSLPIILSLGKEDSTNKSRQKMIFHSDKRRLSSLVDYQFIRIPLNNFHIFYRITPLLIISKMAIPSNVKVNLIHEDSPFSDALKRRV